MRDFFRARSPFSLVRFFPFSVPFFFGFFGCYVVEEELSAPVCATLIYHIPGTAHKPDICTPGTAHHPNFSHMLVLLLGSLGVYILY
jgi:hypothetical protein